MLNSGDDDLRSIVSSALVPILPQWKMSAEYRNSLLETCLDVLWEDDDLSSSTAYIMQLLVVLIKNSDVDALRVL